MGLYISLFVDVFIDEDICFIGFYMFFTIIYFNNYFKK